MVILLKKLIRTAWNYKTQFISMIIMMTLGIGIFLGFNMEWKTIEYDVSNFFSDTKYADYRLYSETGFTKGDLNNIASIKGVDEAAFMTGTSSGTVERNTWRTGRSSSSTTDTYDYCSIVYRYNTIFQESVTPKLSSKPGQLNTLYSYRLKNHYEDPQNSEVDPTETPETYGEEDFNSKVWHTLLIVVPCVLVAAGVGVAVFFIVCKVKRKQKTAE